MKKLFWMALALFMSVGAADVSAHSFLKKLKQKVETEVENRVTNEAKKYVDKGIEAVTGEKPQLRQSQSGYNKRVPITTIPPLEVYGPIEGKLNGHEWVDLGLPSGTRWATCNIDAAAPGQPGKHYAWGETVTKTTFTDENSKTNKKSMEDISSNPTYDVATAKW